MDTTPCLFFMGVYILLNTNIIKYIPYDVTGCFLVGRGATVLRWLIRISNSEQAKKRAEANCPRSLTFSYAPAFTVASDFFCSRIQRFSVDREIPNLSAMSRRLMMFARYRSYACRLSLSVPERGRPP